MKNITDYSNKGKHKYWNGVKFEICCKIKNNKQVMKRNASK